MNEIHSKIVNSKEIPENYKYYWSYQYRLGKTHIVDYMRKAGAFFKGANVAEIGSAEGGALAAFVEAGAKKALATDIAKSRLDMGAKIAKIAGLKIDFKEHDILTDKINFFWREKFDLVLLRDVIEHIDKPVEALKNISKLIKPDGFLLATFPPYYSPYGGHQHTVMNRTGMLPFIHLLPRKAFLSLVKSGRPNDVGEVMRLRNIRMTPRKFADYATQAGYSVYSEDRYFLRPVFKMKFGLPTVKLGFLKNIPALEQFLSLEASFIVKKSS